MIHLERLDHLVLTVADIERSCDFYQRVLGMQVVRFGAGRTALQFGQQKINLHPASAPLQPHALRPTPGSADLCLVTHTAMVDVLAHLQAQAIAVEEGPATRTGALGPIESVYFRDPDGNLIEVSRYPGEEHLQR
ncbi:VOC family protein [Stenotrophomonas maltophilia]|nr:VOC family protein [Stenotrophomonas maltophilia]MCI1147715.1 VOC family protein [Stenotrophomonas maltophilia]